MLRNVAAVALQGVGTFGLGVVSEIFGYDRSADGLPAYDFAVVAAEPPPLRTDTGLLIAPEHGLDRLAAADLVIVAGWEHLDREPPPALLGELRAAVDRGARVMGHCTGAFVVAAAGLLDGRRATTHWRHAAGLAARYPAVTVDPDVLYVESGPVITSAGTAAGIDACLYLLRQEHGSAVANAIARRLVVPPHRDGGQAQYIEAPVPARPAKDEPDHLGEVLEWVQAHLDAPLTVEQMAERAMMSPRSFARKFRATTGTTPYAWLLAQRVRLAETLLEAGEMSVEEVARRAGFGSPATLRMHFARERGVAPMSYRRTFRSAAF